MILKCAVFLLVLPLLSLKKDTSKDSYTLQGVVTEKTTGKPLQNIYLYTVKGVEEAITDQKGEFKIVTWQKLPVNLHVRHNDNENTKVVVANPSARISIKL